MVSRAQKHGVSRIVLALILKYYGWDRTLMVQTGDYVHRSQYVALRGRLTGLNSRLAAALSRSPKDIPDWFRGMMHSYGTIFSSNQDFVIYEDLVERNR